MPLAQALTRMAAAARTFNVGSVSQLRSRLGGGRARGCAPAAPVVRRRARCGALGQPPQVAIVGVAEPVAEGEQRRLPGPAVHRRRTRRAPARKTAAGRESRSAPSRRRARNSTSAMPPPSGPGSHAATKLSAALISAFDPQRPPGEQHRRPPARRSARRRLSSARSRLSAAAVLERGHVARELRVRVLAEHHDRDVRAGVKLARRRSSSARAAGRLHAARRCPRRSTRRAERPGSARVPCQLMVQPPLCLAMLSAPSPATSTRSCGDSGSRWLRFFSSTSDSRTAWRATARCAGGAEQLVVSGDSGRDEGRPSVSRCARSFTRRMRRTASSRRLAGICAGGAPAR